MSALPLQPGSTRRIRTLVVDDSAVALQTITTFLHRHSAVEVVGTAENGEQAVDAVRRLQPELVLMDVQMPRMNGLEASAQITREFPDTRVVLLSVNDTPEVRQAANESGAMRFVPKPQLYRMIGALLEQISSA
jgi:DNA-binding NarL/FixJ family response regulator